MDNNVYTQIGIVLIIALASKNAILIVEFAREMRARGEAIREAAVEAARLRFRPILMTSFAFILGVVPLVFAAAPAPPGSALGTAVFGGMIASTVLAVFFVPVFFVLFQNIGEYGSAAKESKSGTDRTTVGQTPAAIRVRKTIKALPDMSRKLRLHALRPTTSRLKSAHEYLSANVLSPAVGMPRDVGGIVGECWRRRGAVRRWRRGGRYHAQLPDPPQRLRLPPHANRKASRNGSGPRRSPSAPMKKSRSC